MYEEKNHSIDKDFHQRPKWILATIFILLIQASPSFSDLFLDFVPCWNNYKKWIELSFIVIGFCVFYRIYQKDKQKHRDRDRMSLDGISENELLKKSIKKFEWILWREKIFKYYPLNIITLRFIPLLICRIITLFINKKYKSYLFDSFYFPTYWKEDNYEEVTKYFFKSMFRVYIEALKQSYEIKFGRNFTHIEIRWNEKNNRSFGEPKNELYEKIFSENNLDHIKIFTWIFPFGLYWNLIRVIKSLKKTQGDIL